ncbi:hypothetical protein D9M68_960760 [compost metagenome]
MSKPGTGKAGVNRFIRLHVNATEHATDVLSHRLAALGVHVEDRHLDTLGRQPANHRLAQSRRTASHHCSNARSQFHTVHLR